uniref:Uncharacterized protein n=1 Tax=Plectus sambesii TaxID=2011161 RepID=A0A914UUU1_9BILA
MTCLALYAIFLIASCSLFVRSDDTGLQTFTLTAVNATVMRLDSVDTTVPLSYVFTVFGNRSTANCTFTGLNPTKSDWIVSSRCPGVTNEGRFYVNRTAFDFEFEDSWQMTGPWTVYAVQRSRTVSGGSEDDPSYEPLPPTALERRWDFALGRFVIEEHHIIVDDTNKPSSSGTVPIGKKRRKKRNVLSDNQLELGVNVDQCLWDQFLSAYGPDTSAVRKALDYYVDAIVATANLMWNLDSIQPNLNIRIVKVRIRSICHLFCPAYRQYFQYQVWTTQPEDAPAAYHDDIENYLQSTCLLAKPNASGFDHSTVLSGTICLFGIGKF